MGAHPDLAGLLPAGRRLTGSLSRNSPVNSFRVVLNTYFGQDMKLLPDETYFTSQKAGGPFIDITERREFEEELRLAMDQVQPTLKRQRSRLPSLLP